MKKIDHVQLRLWVCLTGALLVLAAQSCNRTQATKNQTPAHVGVSIFQNHELQPLKAYATKYGRPDSILVRIENPVPGDIVFVWDTNTGEGDVWGFNRDMTIEKLEGSSGVEATSSLVTVSDRDFMPGKALGDFTMSGQFRQFHRDGHRLHAEDCRPPEPAGAFLPHDRRLDPSVLSLAPGETDAIFQLTAAAPGGDIVVDIRDLKHCKDAAHNALIDILSLKEK